MPGSLAHRGLELDRLVQTMFFTTEGILGTPLAVSSTFIFLFLLFGSFLIKTGVGEYLMIFPLQLQGEALVGPQRSLYFLVLYKGPLVEVLWQMWLQVEHLRFR